MENKDKKPENNTIFFIIIIAMILCLIAVLGSIRQQDNMELYSYNDEDLEPIAGMTQYMSHLQYHCLEKAEPDMEAVEAAVTPVAVPESDIPETEEEVEEDGSEPKYDLNNQEELAHVIYCEVGNLGEDAMYYCGSVVLNRVEDDRFPGDIHNVIFQSGQYSCTTDGNWQKFSNIPDICWEIAEDLLVNGSVIPPDVIFQAQFVQGPIWKQVGNTYFCY